MLTSETRVDELDAKERDTHGVGWLAPEVHEKRIPVYLRYEVG